MINALGSNQCLQVLDISGNGMGDVGARLLAKALQINTRLRQIMLDRNNITLQGKTNFTPHSFKHFLSKLRDRKLLDTVYQILCKVLVQCSK